MSNVRASNKKSRIKLAMGTVLKAFESNPEKVALAVFKGAEKRMEKQKSLKSSLASSQFQFFAMKTLKASLCQKRTSASKFHTSSTAL
ncbi:MAG TPA: hypothetical protein EYP30_06230 [Archaeoglobaceae archaeon]|nr:hypothetical protein [Archaeoglobaceae archaeon]